jgi:hypothetical protein
MQLTKPNLRLSGSTVYFEILKASVRAKTTGCFKAPNQVFLLRLLLSKMFSKHLLLYTDSKADKVDKHESAISNYGEPLSEILLISSGKAFLERKNSMKQYGQLLSFSNFEAADFHAESLRHHANCVELLALCCGGGNFGCAVRCSSVLPFEVGVFLNMRVS